MTRTTARPESTRTDAVSGRYGIFECPTCGSIALALGEDESDLRCHGEPMDSVTGSETANRPRDVRDVLQETFDLPKAGLAIQGYVLANGPQSASEVAAALEYDRSTATRYLNALVDLQFLQLTKLNMNGGGVTTVYYPTDHDRVPRRTVIGFLSWAGRAGERIAAVSEEMQDRSRDGPDRVPPAVFWG